MDSTMFKIQQKLDHILKYLTPLLPLANCHMVEFFTDHHWERLVPEALAKELQNQNLDEVINNFWDVALQKKVFTESKMAEFVSKARSRCVAVDNEICISVNELEAKIKKWGGHLEPEIHVKEFMNTKKSYEVQTMSRLVASLQRSIGGSHCVDAGGGRGQLPAVLALGYGLRGLTVDCDPVAIQSGITRERLIQKQWHSIAKQAKTTNIPQKNDCQSLHKYVNAFVTKDTDLSSLVKEAFPEHTGDMKLLLTGLHTCGNLGPASLRLFAANAASAVFNVPCCYHLLTEAVDDGLWSVFERNYGERSTDPGFPMSEYMRGQQVQLGRNARMLAAQCVERVASRRVPPPRSLLHRAVLQVIIKEHLHLSNIAEGKLKRISTKCQTLRDYVEAADEILKLGLKKLNSDVLKSVFSAYEGRWEQLVVFYLLRLCLAQVVESAILLDRLLYLRECGFEEVFLVRLFDPVLSPRCHAIVAIR